MRAWPTSADVRYALGYGLVIPLWITAMCVAFLAHNGARACVGCALLTNLPAAAVYGMPLP